MNLTPTACAAFLRALGGPPAFEGDTSRCSSRCCTSDRFGDRCSGWCCSHRTGVPEDSASSLSTSGLLHPCECSPAWSLALGVQDSRTRDSYRGGLAPGHSGSALRATRTRVDGRGRWRGWRSQIARTRLPVHRSSSNTYPSSGHETRSALVPGQDLDGPPCHTPGNNAGDRFGLEPARRRSLVHSARTGVQFFHSSNLLPMGHAAGRANVAAAPVFVAQGGSS